ncbi:MAG TPA: ATP-binding protein [Vicinamibacterales bacterium]|nr:ATP-binding protein [Vicinamibacterales bacterium]
MLWLLLGILYSFAYVTLGWLLRDQPTVLGWFRAGALLVPPMAGTIVIVRRRQSWSGCQWLFWATIALGLAMSAIGLTGWAADELVFERDRWLAWPAVFALFGAVAPLFALLAQPHRGAREPLAATTAIDIAGLVVVTGFLYSFFVTVPDAGNAGAMSSQLKLVSELQQLVVVVAMFAATIVARRTAWHSAYRRLALGALVSFATLTMSNIEIVEGFYRSGFVYDFTWILPFAFFPWAAASAPASEPVDSIAAEDEELARPRPWVIFTAVALLPFLDFGLRHVMPDEASRSFRDLSTAVTLISVLPLLVARIAAERAELQQASSTTKLLAEVLEQARDLILVLTPDGRCRHANAAFCRAVGRSREELGSMNARELLAHETLTARDIQATARDGGAWHGMVMRTRKDGTTFPVTASIAPVIGPDGRATHIVSVEQDISEERRLKEQLIHSERLSAVGQLVAGVAHEINNPLQAVMGFTELLIDKERRPEVREDLLQIRTDAGRAAKIVHNLLLFARRETLERSVADLNEIVRSTVALRAFDYRTRQLALQQELSSEVPLIVANRAQIQQVLVNLLLNAEQAVRASNQPGTVTVCTGRLNGAAFVDIADSGPGVPAGTAGKVFEPFFTTKPVGEGTGLGLSVSLGIAEAHGGSLQLVPSARGACFRLTLPAAALPRGRRGALSGGQGLGLGARARCSETSG